MVGCCEIVVLAGEGFGGGSVQRGGGGGVVGGVDEFVVGCLDGSLDVGESEEFRVGEPLVGGFVGTVDWGLREEGGVGNGVVVLVEAGSEISIGGGGVVGYVSALSDYVWGE